ncbi:MAG: molybdopterin-dependent oxidoreductase [Woeseiaceae bacterium]|nr:molybdopterin-dependent oxidoreductase [Woeseiaceae bacterium]
MSELKRISRREFLKRTGQAGGLVFALTFSSSCSREPAPPVAATGTIANVMPNVYVNIRNDGIVDIYCHRSEMGQGIRTGLPQVIADELEADWDKINLIQALGDDKYASQNTDGSTSIRNQFDILRNAGATARETLIAAAAATWGVPASECVARNHAVHHEASGNFAGFGALVDAAQNVEIPQNAEFKSPEDYRYIGKPVDTIDGFDMSTGKAMYAADIVLPDMLYASVVRSPVLYGTVKSVDDSAARAVAGVVDVLRLPDATVPVGFNPQGGVAVLASSSWAAMQGRNALEVEWEPGDNATHESENYRKTLEDAVKAAGSVKLDRGDVDKAFADAVSTHDALYYAPYLAHASMEPPCAVARATDDGGFEIWSCTQNPQAVQETIAGLFQIDKQLVKAHVTLLGGGFGRKSKADFQAEACWLARESGRPVQVLWTREDDVRNGYLHSVSAQYFKAGLDADGNASSMLHRSAFPPIASTFAPNADEPMSFELDLGFHDNPYGFDNLRGESCKASAHFRIGWLRSVCNVFHAFGVCGFMDELAYLANEDPKDYLLKMLLPARTIDPADDGASYGNYGHGLDVHPVDTGRVAAVVEKAASMADWGRALPDGRGLGIAVHRSFASYVATVAEVVVDANGKLAVHDLWIAVDAGLVVNPDRVVSQMEGAGIFGMSIALHGEITAKDGAVVQGNYDTYPVVRMSEAPAAIHVHIMDSDAPPGGVGEPGVPPVAPAIVNAYYAATGQRIRELPLRNAGLT